MDLFARLNIILKLIGITILHTRYRKMNFERNSNHNPITNNSKETEFKNSIVFLKELNNP